MIAISRCFATRSPRTASIPWGLYFGTRGGQLFASRDEGETWSSIADWLPAVLCVKAVAVA